MEAVDNNPLKFSPSARDALATMFGPKSSGYLDAQRAFVQAFEDLKAHQLRTYSAMQHALTIILSDLDPKKIERDSEAAAVLVGFFNRAMPSSGRHTKQDGTPRSAGKAARLSTHSCNISPNITMAETGEMP